METTPEELRAYLDEWVRNQKPIFARIDSEFTGAPRVTYYGRLGKPPGDGDEGLYFTFALVDQTSVRGFDFTVQAVSFEPQNQNVFGKAVGLRWTRQSANGEHRTVRMILSEQTHV